ncbi:hypothetical protein C7S20_12255 [Christiangramia fulva]|uniref:HEAT repeat domain-containing protein n=1 Tax=Christiangramia fulva TaxID=2126553 RepID=A0A2R3Z6W0_9FLAO|nr:HEAT repeat domain-containing protein [Christiangramia fulva]AVR45964.1 hypothetical protein C7S20_12255 [Christiangramia fulva]
MNEEILIFLIKIASIILVIFWISIAYSFFYRKKRFKIRHKIELTFAEIVSQYLYNDPNDPLDIRKIQHALEEVGVRPGEKKNIQYLIRLMIRTQRTILGRNYHKLKNLYAQIQPYGASFSKISGIGWYKKAQGIREIYEMDQSQYLDNIFKFRNHRNIYVRREAQIALVVFMGWESLRFLPYLKRKITLWQQIKIVEKLADLYPTPELNWLHKAYKTDKLFGKKLLMRIIRKFQLHEEVDFIIQHLKHPDYEVRETAIYCIQTFAVSDERMNYIKHLYDSVSNPVQQAQLLEYIHGNSEIDLDFYMKNLYEGNDDLKLKIAEILWNNGYKEKVQEFYYQQYPKNGLYV